MIFFVKTFKVVTSLLRAEVQVEADLLRVEVLVDQEVDDNGKLLQDKVSTVLLNAGQEITEPEENFLNLKLMEKHNFS